MSTFHPIYAPTEQPPAPPPPPERSSRGPVIAAVLVAAAVAVGAFFVGTTQATTETPVACRQAIQEAAHDYGLFADFLDAIQSGDVIGMQSAAGDFQRSEFATFAADCLGTGV